MDIKQLIGDAPEYDKKQELENKRPKSWCKSISAFANGIGGSLVFGVANDDTFVGDMSINVDIERIATNLGIVSIKVKSTNGFKLVLENHQDITLPYNLFEGNSVTPLIQDAEIGNYTSVQDTSVVLNAKVHTQNLLYSGTYEDALTFTIQYSEAA